MHHDAAPPPQPGPRTGTIAAALVAAWVLALAYLTCSAQPRDTGHRTAPSPPRSSSAPPPVQPKPVDPQRLARLARATTFATLAAAPRDRHPQAKPTGLVAHPRRTLPLYTKPGGRAFAALPTRQLASPTWLPVIDTRPGWVRVLLPARPNGSAAWLPRNDSTLRVARNPYRIVVDRATFQLTLYRGWIPLGLWTVGIGKPSAVTPHGRTFILAALRDPKSTFSDIVVPLGAHSDTHHTYGGGPGTVGIHTWPTSDVYGTASSDGCIRVPNDALTDISTTVPTGTPVLIR